jgi:hypothetical protein
MARQLKFRIWDRQHKRFVDNAAGTHCYSNWHLDAFSGQPVDFVACYGGEQGWNPTLNPEYYMDGAKVVKEPRYVVQQALGILDKNGAEIYEEDIVKLDGAPYQYEVVWNHWQWGIDSKGVVSEHIQGITSAVEERAIVIGNIFENPKLLKNE